MNTCYTLPYAALIGLILMLAVILILQTLSLSYGWYRLGRKWITRWENLTELLILCYLLLLASMLAEISFHAQDSFFFPIHHEIPRILIFVMLTVCSAASIFQKRVFWPLCIPLAAAISLPQVEHTVGCNFPILFTLSLGFWLMRSIHLLLLRHREQKNHLSILSIKEAVDTLDSGLLFYAKEGQIVLQNTAMQTLSISLTGQFQYNGKDFYTALQQGHVLPSCQKEKLGEQLAYRLPDGSVWGIERHTLTVRHQEFFLLIASDTTERWQAAQHLWQKNQELEERNQELKRVLENLETICRTEATLHAKSRVHDILGQQISLLLRSMREHQEPDEVLLSAFAQGLPKELTSNLEVSNSLDSLVRAFQGLGVTIHLSGQNLKQQGQFSQTLFEIAAEAVTNAVRHGYASEIEINSQQDSTAWVMTITDNGIPPSVPITEGGGLTGMRQKVHRLGGTFAYTTHPQFCIQVKLPILNDGGTP